MYLSHTDWICTSDALSINYAFLSKLLHLGIGKSQIREDTTVHKDITFENTTRYTGFYSSEYIVN